MLIDEAPLEYIGTDESGKGDYFGPLVIAGVHIDLLNINKLESLNILESKRIADNRAISLAEKIKQAAPSSVVIIGPEKYNELQARMKNLNHLLGWGHARVIENMLERKACPAAISDQFGDESLIRNSLMKKGRDISLFQTPRAERFLAVAAASVLARAAFLLYLRKLSTEFGLEFPKGASNLVDLAGSEFIARHGRDRLGAVAKLHFKNTRKIEAIVNG